MAIVRMGAELAVGGEGEGLDDHHLVSGSRHRLSSYAVPDTATVGLHGGHEP
jgi:hypothetical protein